MINTLDDDALIIFIKKRLRVEELEAVIINFGSDGIDEYAKLVSALFGRGSYSYAPKKLDLILKNTTSPPTRPSIKESPILELNVLPSHL